MKKIDELGISPWPWKVNKTHERTFVSDGSNMGLSLYDEYTPMDARLVAAAPELYECLREAVVESCHECEDDTIENCRGKCFIAKWRDVLAKASGESEEEQ